MRAATDFSDNPVLIVRRIDWSADSTAIYAALAERNADVILLDGLIEPCLAPEMSMRTARLMTGSSAKQFRRQPRYQPDLMPSHRMIRTAAPTPMRAVVLAVKNG